MTWSLQIFNSWGSHNRRRGRSRKFEEGAKDSGLFHRGGIQKHTKTRVHAPLLPQVWMFKFGVLKADYTIHLDSSEHIVEPLLQRVSQCVYRPFRRASIIVLCKYVLVYHKRQTDHSFSAVLKRTSRLGKKSLQHFSRSVQGNSIFSPSTPHCRFVWILQNCDGRNQRML